MNAVHKIQLNNAQLLINGEFVESKTQQWQDIVNPATQEVLGRVPFATPDEVNAAIAAAQNPALTTHIPMGCTSVDPYDPLYMETDAAKLPAVIASIGYGDFWRGEFVRRFVQMGVFEFFFER